jgi:hypothetical protein
VRIDGNTLPQAPKWIANVTAGYSWPLSSGEIFVFTDWAYRSKVNFFLYQSAEFSDDHQLEGGLRLGYRAPEAKWEAPCSAATSPTTSRCKAASISTTSPATSTTPAPGASS